MSDIFAAFSGFNAAWTALKTVLGWFGISFGADKPKPTENTQAIEVANDAGQLSAENARETRAKTQTAIEDNDARTNSDLTDVRSADSLCDAEAAIDRAIARTGAHADSDR